MKVTIDAAPGELADKVGGVIDGIVDAAVRDGADRGAVIEKAARAVGASGVEVPVDALPRYRAVGEGVERAVSAFHLVMARALEAVEARLTQAAVSVDRVKLRRDMGGPDEHPPLP